jgi:Protein of unknown function (DUF3592)
LFRHHEHEKPPTEAQREKLISDGATIQGTVMHNEPSPADRQRSQVRVNVRFKDGQGLEFTEELASLYQPAPGSPEAQRLAEVRTNLRHPDRVPKVQLPLSAGQRVQVRYDAANPSKLVLDVPALQKRALRDYIEREQKSNEEPQPPADAHEEPHSQPARARTGPPWVVPTHCPNCGAPVDQAKASRDRDPLCKFCHQPIPVSPLV